MKLFNKDLFFYFMLFFVILLLILYIYIKDRDDLFVNICNLLNIYYIMLKLN